MNDIRTRNDQRIIGLLLIDDFALMSYAAIIEPYRAANVLAGRALYTWVHISTGGLTIAASNGASFVAERTVRQALDCDVLFVFAGGDPSTFNDAATFAWLRKVALTRTIVAGISGGPFLLARAGLLDGHRATIHWEHQPAFVERFPMIATQPGLYVVDRRRVTCAGGTAGMDLAIDLIERDHGHDLASRVGDWFIRTEARAADKPQRLSLRERYNVRNDRLLRVLAQMEAFVEEPLSSQQLAAAAGISVRQLERLFAAHRRQSVQETYRNIRLEQADQLLRTTGLSATAIAIACGFRSSSHFSRAFKARFGHAPMRAVTTPEG